MGYFISNGIFQLNPPQRWSTNVVARRCWRGLCVLLHHCHCIMQTQTTAVHLESNVYLLQTSWSMFACFECHLHSCSSSWSAIVSHDMMAYRHAHEAYTHFPSIDNCPHDSQGLAFSMDSGSEQQLAWSQGCQQGVQRFSSKRAR